MRILLITSVVLVAGLAVFQIVNSASLSLSAEDDVIEILKKDHDKFFKSLGETERIWILRLALKHEAQKLVNSFPHNTIFNPSEILVPTKPVDETSLIPEGLYDAMLNGQVSTKFQKDMIKWLRKEYGIEDEEFAKFNSRSNQICHNGKCWDLGDIGSECCPFG